MFDPRPGPGNALYVDHPYPAAVVLERFVPPVEWVWGYPVYLLRTALGYACVSGPHEGVLVNVLVVFTDSDLADRAAAAAPEVMPLVPVDSGDAFARLVRELPADVVGVAFDPPEPGRGGVARNVVFRETLLSNLDDTEL